MEHVIVEGRYTEPTTPEAILASDERQRFCFDLYRSHPVTHYLALDGISILCVLRAPDAEAVRRTNARLGLPFERVWAAASSARTPPVRPSLPQHRRPLAARHDLCHDLTTGMNSYDNDNADPASQAVSGSSRPAD